MAKRKVTTEELDLIIWKPVKGYEGYYEVSNTGLVRGVDRTVFYSNDRMRFMRQRLLKFGFDKDGYADVCLSKEGKYSTARVHRLVAIAFIPNPESKPTVNHLNGIVNDNKVANLEWSTVSENTLHGFHSLGRQIHNKKKINQYTMDGEFMKEWPSITEAAIALNGKSKLLNQKLTRKQYTYFGFIWKYAS